MQADQAEIAQLTAEEAALLNDMQDPSSAAGPPKLQQSGSMMIESSMYLETPRSGGGPAGGGAVQVLIPASLSLSQRTVSPLLLSHLSFLLSSSPLSSPFSSLLPPLLCPLKAPMMLLQEKVLLNNRALPCHPPPLFVALSLLAGM